MRSPLARSSSPVAPASYASAAARSASSRERARRSMRAKLAVLGLVSLSVLTSGCYLGHVTSGQLRLLRARQPIDELVSDPGTPAELRQRLEVVSRARDFARDLGLDVDDQYTTYVDWPGDRIATVIVSARPGEVEPAGFWFPIVGTLPYKGFFDPARAEAEADRLRNDGLDVCVSGVTAYSTLGWIDDPVTGPMVRRPQDVVVETVIHELVHATVYVRDDVDLNEGIAAFIGEEGVIRFYEQAGDTERADATRTRVAEDRRFTTALTAFRARVIELNETQAPGEARDAARAGLEAEFRASLGRLDFATRDAGELAEAVRLNDACLAWYGTYYAEMPRYAALLEALGGDLVALIAKLRAAAETDDARTTLFAILDEGIPGT